MNVTFTMRVVHLALYNMYWQCFTMKHESVAIVNITTDSVIRLVVVSKMFPWVSRCRPPAAAPLPHPVVVLVTTKEKPKNHQKTKKHAIAASR